MRVQDGKICLYKEILVRQDADFVSRYDLYDEDTAMEIVHTQQRIIRKWIWENEQNKTAPQ